MSVDSDSETLIGNSPRGSSPPATQVTGFSKVKYAWIILFTMDVDRELPFSIIRLTHFKDFDFPWKGITEEMTDEYRTCLRTFPNFQGGHQHCIFAKVEHGKLTITRLDLFCIILLA